jgi:general secretion pathway protein M
VTDPNRPRIVCILAWAAALAIPVTLLVGIGWPWLERVGALEQEIASLDDRIAHYHRLVQTLPLLQTELERVRSNKDVENYYFEAKTPALAGAEVQRRVQQMVESAGGQVTSTQLLPAQKDEQPPKVRVRTQIKGNTDMLLDVLYQIEQARPFLFVDQLSVRAPPQRRTAQRNRRIRRRARANSNASRQGELTVRLDVLGYALEGKP